MWRRVCAPGDVPQDGMKEFTLDDASKVLIVSAGDEYFAYQALCPHEAVSLADGVHDGAIITCLEHLWQFDLKTGAPLGDSDTGLTGYRLKQEDGALHVWKEGAAKG
jgi:toluene monooxygenase system ferredoxin subunit